jgi:uncharacterized protein (DUF4415 family)
MNKEHSDQNLTAEQQAELAMLEGLSEAEINTQDIPEQRDWSGAKRGVFYRPIKQQITLRLDADVVDWFRQHPQSNAGYQTRINAVLRSYVEQEQLRGNDAAPLAGLRSEEPAPAYRR